MTQKESSTNQIGVEEAKKLIETTLDNSGIKFSTEDKATITSSIGGAIGNSYYAWIGTRDIVRDIKRIKNLQSISQGMGIDLSKEIPGGLCEKLSKKLCDSNFVKKFSKKPGMFSDFIKQHAGCEKEAIQQKLNDMKDNMTNIMQKYENGFEKRANQLLRVNYLASIGTLLVAWKDIYQANQNEKLLHEKIGKLQEIKIKYIQPLLNAVANYDAINHQLIKQGLVELNILQEQCRNGKQRCEGLLVSNSVNTIGLGISTSTTFTLVSKLSNIANPWDVAASSVLLVLQGVTTIVSGCTAIKCYKNVQQWTTLINKIDNCIVELLKLQKECPEMDDFLFEARKQQIKNEVHRWLINIKRGKLWPLFEENEYTEMDVIIDMTIQDLKDIGIDKIGARKRIIKSIQEYKKQNC